MVGLIAMLSQGALAHTYLSSVYLNGAALAEGDCVRPHPATAYDSPIPLLTASVCSPYSTKHKYLFLISDIHVSSKWLMSLSGYDLWMVALCLQPR